ncbi:MAG: DUF1538 domain-containing protein [Clostridia bacterium]|nr:DUF1538 domain-containing protein [Clostridia bacterium]
MLKNLWQKLRESIFAVLPVTAIVLIAGMTFIKLDSATIVAFVSGSFLFIIGMALFSLGAEMAMMPLGESVGAKLAESKKLWVIIPIFFLMGFLITIAEPDLQVLSDQVSTVPKWTLILAVSGGVGVFMVLFLLRTVFKMKFAHILVIAYAIVFVLAIFVPQNFLALAFDSGGVTTGPISVPFLMALGIGLSTVRSGSKEDQSFGMIALCSVGPIIAVMIIGIIFKPADIIVEQTAAATQGLFGQYLTAFPHYLGEVGIALLPIIALFVLFQTISLRLPKRTLVKILIGFFYTYIGLSIFLMAVNVGFLPAGKLIGAELATRSYSWVLIPFGMVIGFAVVLAEPAIHILIEQVEDLTGGAISKKIILLCLTLGISLSIGLAMIRVLTGLSIWYFLVPGYLIALVLTFFVPSIFTSIAFDSGGVASGPMTVTFLLPFAMGASAAVGGNIMTDAFGLVAMVAMTPLLTVQIFGMVYKIKLKAKSRKKPLPAAASIAVQEEPVSFE